MWEVIKAKIFSIDSFALRPHLQVMITTTHKMKPKQTNTKNTIGI